MPAPTKKATGPEVPDTDLLLVTVTKIEVEALLAGFGTTATKSRRIIDNKTYYDLGEIGGSRILMVRSEMGSGGVDGSFPTIDDAIRTLDPGAVIMVGIAFGVDPDKQRIGDVLVARQLQGYDLKKVGTDIESEDRAEIVLLRDDRPSCSPRLLDRFRHGELDWQGAGRAFDLMLSGSSLVDHIDYRDQLKKLVPEAVGGEMEGVGLYAAAHRHKVDWILVKAICDFADGNKKKDKKQRQQLAAANAVAFVTHVLKLGGLAKEGNQNDLIAAEAEKKYLRELRKQCNYLPLGAMGGEQDFSEGISLDQVYVELYTKTLIP